MFRAFLENYTIFIEIFVSILQRLHEHLCFNLYSGLSESTMYQLLKVDYTSVAIIKLELIN